MEKRNKLQNIAGASVFGALGIGALAGVLFVGATHQLAMVAVCALMVTILVAEIQQEKKKAKKQPDNQ